MLLGHVGPRRTSGAVRSLLGRSREVAPTVLEIGAGGPLMSHCKVIVQAFSTLSHCERVSVSARGQDRFLRRKEFKCHVAISQLAPISKSDRPST